MTMLYGDYPAIGRLMADRIIEGKKGFTFDQVPEKAKEDTAYWLKELGYAHLINDERFK